MFRLRIRDEIWWENYLTFLDNSWTEYFNNGTHCLNMFDYLQDNFNINLKGTGDPPVIEYKNKEDLINFILRFS